MINNSEQETLLVLLDKSQQADLFLQNQKDLQFSPWFQRQSQSRHANKKAHKLRQPITQIRTAFSHTLQVPNKNYKLRNLSRSKWISHKNQHKRQLGLSVCQNKKARIMPLNINWQSKERFLYNPYNAEISPRYSPTRQYQTVANSVRENTSVRKNVSTNKSQIQQKINIVSVNGIFKNRLDNKDRIIIRNYQTMSKTSKKWIYPKPSIDLVEKVNRTAFVGLVPMSQATIYKQLTKRLNKLSFKDRQIDANQYLKSSIKYKK